MNWSKVGRVLAETLKSFGRGDIILRLRMDKLFPFILHLFILAWISIWLSYKIEQTNGKKQSYHRNIADR